ncbi:hypothetical protein [Neptunicoccus sediminis]|uniref:hypothetical protein n=1 Tax=Neptunicoccus sediminis TaxID=1892596 RepID=UPI0012FF9029|nr:hypothetical protein [Neptunicoccus sediminis]
MTQFPKIQARFDAALAVFEDAADNSADAGKLEEQAATIERLKEELTTAQDALDEAKARIDEVEAERKAALEKAENQRVALVKQIDTLDKARATNENNLTKARQYNKHLKKLNSGLRKQNEAHVGDVDLINASLEAEINQIKEQRDVDLEEVNGILARMTPLVEGN